MHMKWEPSAFKSDQARANGLGSAHSGTHHWLHQRITAIATMLLMIWFLDGILYISQMPHHVAFTAAIRWVGLGINPVLLSLLIISTFYHASLGLRVVIDDYIPNPGGKLFIIIAVDFALFLCGGMCLYAIIKAANLLTLLQLS